MERYRVVRSSLLERLLELDDVTTERAPGDRYRVAAGAKHIRTERGAKEVQGAAECSPGTRLIHFGPEKSYQLVTSSPATRRADRQIGKQGRSFGLGQAGVQRPAVGGGQFKRSECPEMQHAAGIASVEGTR